MRHAKEVYGAFALYGTHRQERKIRKMKYALRAEEMKAYDQDTMERIGIPSVVLMERAALSVLQTFDEMKLSPGKVLIVAGVGNNGGDGLALGRLLLERGWDTAIYMEGNPERMTGETRLQRKILENSGFSIQSKIEDREYDMVIDALFGIGLSREITGSCRELVEQVNHLRSQGALVCSLDVPSGICADDGRALGCCVHADFTVTFAFAKIGHLLYPGREFTGKLFVRDIGVTEKSFVCGKPSAFYYERGDLPSLLPKRQRAGNKGTFGKVLLAAGSVNMAGAAVLAARAAYRAGAGMVKVITAAENRIIVQQAVPEALFGTWEFPEEDLEWADVIAVGPGLGKGDAAKRCLEQVIQNSRKPLLVDADGLNLLSEDVRLRAVLAEQAATGRILVLTPHVGELARLAGKTAAECKDELPGIGQGLAETFHGVVAAKDARTFICGEGHAVCVNLSGNCGMATAGSGDVLAGIIAALLAQGMEAFEAAAVGSYIHGRAGDRVSGEKGTYACMAWDIAEAAGR